MKASYSRLLLVLILVALAAWLASSEAGDLVTLERLKSARSALAAQAEAEPLMLAGAFFLVCAAFATLSLPGIVILKLAGGAIFGLWTGLALVSFATVTGASLACLGSRYLFRGWVERRFGARLAAIDRGIARDGDFYLVALRLNPAVPYFLVNLGMGLTRMPVIRFAAVSLFGMLPVTFVYVLAGTEIARIRELSDIASPGLIGALVALSLLPLLGKWIADRFRQPRP